MIYYPLSVLMLAGLREIAIITTPEDQEQFRRLLRDGSQWGMRFEYVAQPRPEGLAQAYLLAEDFLDGAASTMVLGDNIFFGHDLPAAAEARRRAARGRHGLRLPGRRPRALRRRRLRPRGPGAVDRGEAGEAAVELRGHRHLRARRQRARRAPAPCVPSPRGELEITELLNSYLKDGLLSVERMGRGFAWLDTGTHASLLDAGNFVRTIEERQNVKIGCPEEIAFAEGWIDARRAARARRALPEDRVRPLPGPGRRRGLTPRRIDAG